MKILSVNEYSLQFSQISTKDGLSQNTVRSILEDKKGFIWLGTLDGLNRYDGYHIVTYKPQLGNPRSLIDHRVKNIFQDKDGYLWIKSYKGEFCCYDPVSDSFIDYLHPSSGKQNALYSNYYESSRGDIWLWGNTDGCLRLRKKKKTFSATSFLTEKEENTNNCRFLLEDSKANVWICGDGGLLKVSDRRTEQFYNNRYAFTKAIELNDKLYFITQDSILPEYDIKRSFFQEIKITAPQNIILNAAKLTDTELLVTTRSSGLMVFNVNSKLFEKPAWTHDPQLKGEIEFIVDRKGGVWVYNHSGIMWYHNPVSHKVRKMELIPEDIAGIIDLERYIVFIDSQDLIWITTYGNGLFCYNPETEELFNYKYNANQNSPASDYLLDIMEDHYGNIWIGSDYAGIIKVVKINYNIKIVRPDKEYSIGKNNNVRAVYADVFNRIWIGTKNGSLYLYDEDLSSGKCIGKDINPYTLAEDAQNRIWVGTKGKGLYIIDPKTMQEKAHYTDSGTDRSLSHNTLFSIFKDTKNRIWIGTFGGGINLAEETPQGISFRHFFVNEGNLSYIRCIFQDSNGMMWVGSSDGVLCFYPEELIRNPKAFTHYRMRLDDKLGLNCNDIKTIYEDRAGNIWIGTAGGGINRYVPESGTEKEHFVAHTTANGLAGDFISGIMEDKDNNLWISTESGISKFDTHNNSFITYQFSEKTYGNYFNENANIYYRNGNMMWGSLDGLLVFNPESFVPDANTQSVTFTKFSIYNQVVKAGEKDSPLRQSISYSDNIRLNYKQNTFTIEFASLDLKDPIKNKYVYRLEGYDKQWSSVSHLNVATYKNLSPGKYVFKVKGTNRDGIWNENTTQLGITIIPPFWKTWYAYVAYGLLTLGILYIILRLIYKFNVLNNNIKVEKELTNHKLRFFTNISHEFRTPLTLIRGAVENLNAQTDVSEKTKKQVNVLNRNSTVLTQLIDQLLEFRKLQNNVLTLDLEETDIVDFSKEIFQSFREIAERKNITYTFDSNFESYHLYIDRRKVDKVLYNLLSNAFKFTPKDGKIEFELQIDLKPHTCLIRVKDNGIGIPKDKQHLLFSRFMQINFSHTGTGVGLSLVKEFVDVHKGKVWYESNREQGSIFNVELSSDRETYRGENFIDLPRPDVFPKQTSSILPEPSDPVENVASSVMEDATLSNYKMLIIEDNDDIRRFLVDEFSKHVLVNVAENGVEGLKKAEEINPDLIVCDVMMPEMDGFEVTRKLKEDFRTCHIPIILLTAHSSIEHQLEGIQCGADAYIMKPFSLKYLVARVYKLIEQREQLKKRFSNEYVLDGNLITTTDIDWKFYTMIDKIIEENISDPTFSIDKFAELAKQKRTLFYKKVKGITGISPNEMIRIKRLKKAAELLVEGNLTISEISYKIGFDDPFYFSKCFKAQYNCPPSKYAQTRFEEK